VLFRSYDHIWGLQESFKDLWVPWFNYKIHCTVYFGFVHGRKCYFIEPHSPENFFNRGSYYGFMDEHTRWAFFSKAAMEFMLASGKRPDIIHCHDWQTGLAPVMLYDIYAHNGMGNSRVCYTIHNFKHQGIAGEDILYNTGLNNPPHYFSRDRLGDDFNPSAINFMKGGIVYSNFVTTVSPAHAYEARHTDQGYGMGHTLSLHQQKFGGVLNGLDYDVWNPESDPHLRHKYNSKLLGYKYKNKEDLRERLLLKDDFAPIVAYVGRLDSQKGVELIKHAIFYSQDIGAQFVLLGSSPEAGINAWFWDLKRQTNDNPNVHLEIGYNEELAHLIYAGSDMLIVPSVFEPCGLAQMIALRYGTIPVVRSVGGLSDTVFDRDYSMTPIEKRNGYTFDGMDWASIEHALYRAVGLFYNYPDDFKKLIRQAMACDYSWNHPGVHYINIYEHIRHK